MNESGMQMTTTGHTGDPWMWTQPYYYIYTGPQEPTHCIGKAHVFECAHVKACKCGEIRRVMPKAGGKAS